MKDLQLLNLRKKGEMQGPVAVVITIVIVAMTLILGVLMFSKFAGSIDQSGMSTAENTTITTVKTNVNTGFTTSSILLLVLPVSAIIGAVTYYLARTG